MADTETSVNAIFDNNGTPVSVALLAVQNAGTVLALESAPRVNGTLVSTANPMPVNGTVAVAGAIGGTVTLAAGANNIGTVAVGAGVTLAAGTANVGTVVVNGGSVTVSGTAAVSIANAPTVLSQGLAASGASVAGNPLLHGGRAQTAEPTPVTNGQAVAAAFDAVGRQIIAPWANKESFVTGSAGSATTSPGTIVAAQGSGVKLYLFVQVKNTGTSASSVTLNDTASTVLIAPAGGGDNGPPVIPLVWAANTPATFTPSVASTTVTCNAQGFKGT